MSTRAILDVRQADRLTKLLGMLGSDHDGEVVNAGRAAADQLVRASGLTWFDVIALPAATTPERDWRDVASFCFERAHRLSPRERDFVRAMAGWRGDPTDKQLGWLFAIYDRVQGAA